MSTTSSTTADLVPEWKADLIRRYGDFLTNTGGNDPAELVADLDRNKNMMRTNVVRFVLAVGVDSQLGLLARLENAGLLGGETA